MLLGKGGKILLKYISMVMLALVGIKLSNFKRFIVVKLLLFTIVELKIDAKNMIDMKIS